MSFKVIFNFKYNKLEEGYCKYQSNVSKHRNYITTHRVDTTYSAQYAAFEDQFIKIGRGENNGELKETIYRMDKQEKVLFDNFMYVRNNGWQNVKHGAVLKLS